MGWVKVNKLKVNLDNAEVLLVRSKQSLGSKYTLPMDGIALPWKDGVHSSGVLRPVSNIAA